MYTLVRLPTVTVGELVYYGKNINKTVLVLYQILLACVTECIQLACLSGSLHCKNTITNKLTKQLVNHLQDLIVLK